MSVGMYSTKYFNKNKMDGNAYMCIGDPYKPPVANAFRQPEKGAPKPKTFATTMYPKNAENGHFTKIVYHPHKYQEAYLYINSQPLDSRKQGFGTKDAFKRDEFSNAIRTAQYRASIKSENKHYIKSAEELEEELDKLKAENKTATVSLGTSKYGGQCYNFDIGRSRVNEYNIKSVKDTYYQFDVENGKFVGKDLPSSSDYGRGVWEYDYKPPKFGGKSEVKKFSDRSHLKVGRK